ncbi:MAG: signal recognition particle-docking protein FtsY [Erysipelotrichales bacterium]|nr:MAG: signal recognition particle-docking protein FtsY [Erysipelotrichales bacterium]
MSFFQNLKDKFTKKNDQDIYLSGFRKTSQGFGQKIQTYFSGKALIDDKFYEDLMIILIQSDLGLKTSTKILNITKKKVISANITSVADALGVISEAMAQLFTGMDCDVEMLEDRLNVILVVGVNGSGKTTTVAKLAKLYKDQGKSVVLAAADTFRAGAVTQLEEWAERLDIPCISGKANADPASVVTDACRTALQENYDILLIDTAGRLQNKVNLMNELAKMNRVITKETGKIPDHVWLVLDATTGQNALTQAEAFTAAVSVTGIICTKMDGTAKGGILLSIADSLKIPVKFVGLGENAADLRPFDVESYLYSITEEFNDVG